MEPTNCSHPIRLFPNVCTSRHIYEGVVSHTYAYTDVAIVLTYRTWLGHMGHDSFIWDIVRAHRRRHRTSESCHAFMRVTWLIHMGRDSFIWDLTHSNWTWLIHMGHDSFIWDMTHSYGTWLIHMGHDLLTQTSYSWVMSRSYGTWLTWRTHM